VLAVAIAEPAVPEIENRIEAPVPEADPVPVQVAPEPEPVPEVEAEIEDEPPLQSPLVAAAEALSDLDNLPSEEAIQVLEAVEEALTADILMPPVENVADDLPAEELPEEPVSFASTLGLSESEEEAVNRALAELSVDLDEDLDGDLDTGYEDEEPEQAVRPSVLRR
jgi:hypothetical protein